MSGRNVAAALVQTARDMNVATLCVGHRKRGRLAEIVRPPLAHTLLPQLRGVDLRTVPVDEPSKEDASWMG